MSKNVTMVLSWWSVIILLGIWPYLPMVSSSMCPGNFCQCTETTINCTCINERENLVLGGAIMMDHEIHSVEINHCGRVEIFFRAFTGTNLQLLILFDLDELVLSPYALDGASHLHQIHISNIKTFTPHPFSLQNLQNVSEIFMENVTAKSFPEGFLGVDKLDYLVMKNVHVEFVSKLAITLVTMGYFMVHDSTFDHVESNAFRLLDETYNANWNNNDFGFVEKDGIFFQAVHFLSFNGSRFNTLQDEFMVIDVARDVSFVFNSVILCEAGAFSGTNFSNFPEESMFRFHDNDFQQIQNNCLPKKSEFFHVKEMIAKNVFRCSCEIRWFWDAGYENFLNSSICFGKDAMIEQKPLMIDEICISVGPSQRQSSVPATETNTRKNEVDSEPRKDSVRASTNNAICGTSIILSLLVCSSIFVGCIFMDIC